MFVELIYNAALLVTLSVLYGLLSRFRKGNNTLYKILVGLLFGLIAVAGMNMPVHYSNGIIYDGRSVILVLAGLFGGGIPGAISIVLSAAFRIYLGGTGTLAGVLTVLVSCSVGLAFRYLYKNEPYRINLAMLWLIGLVAHVFMLASQLFLPWPLVFEVIKNIWFPIVVVFPLATLMIGILFRSEEKRIVGLEKIKQSERLFQTLSENSPVGIFRTNIDGSTTYVNSRWCQLSGISADKAMGDGWLVAIHPEDRDIVSGNWKEDLKNNAGSIKEYRFLRENGQVIWVYGEAKPEYSDDGKIIGYIGTISDITDRKKSEKALVQSEENFRRSMDESPLGVRVVAHDDKTLYANTAMLQIVGADSFSEFVNYRMSGFYTNESLIAHSIRKEKRMYGHYVPEEYEVEIINLKGEAKSLQVYRKEIFWNGASNFQLMYRDITDLKEAVTALQESERNYRSLFENHSAVKLMVDPSTGNIINANHAASRFYGWSVDQLKTMNIHQINVMGGEVFNDTLNKANENKNVHFEFKHRLANGEIRDVDIFISKIRFQGVDCLHSIIQDITQRRLALDKLKLLSKSVEQSPVSIIITDPNGNIEYVNPKFTDVTGYTINEVMGQNSRILNSGEQSTEFYKNMWETILSGNDWVDEIQNKKKNGEFYWEKAIIFPILDDTGKITNFIGLKEDITGQKRLIKEVIEAKEKAEESERLKSAFLANMSHEIRTPLNAILGFTQMLAFEEDLSPEQKEEFTSIINRSAEGLLQIISDILDISQLETGLLKLHKTEINVHDLLSELYSQSKLKLNDAQKESIELKMEVPAEIRLYTDRVRLIQIIMNLLNNAIKFTDEGYISFGVFHCDEEKIGFFVSDTGIGINPSIQSNIFERFRQADESLSRIYGGNGLGLAIVKSLTELLGGKIQLESELGKGTTFRFYLPR